jgi:hypothetical protein
MANEKTYPVNVGEARRRMILEIMGFYVEFHGLECTQRAVVERAIQRLHQEMTKEIQKLRSTQTLPNFSLDGENV